MHEIQRGFQKTKRHFSPTFHFSFFLRLKVQELSKFPFPIWNIPKEVSRLKKSYYFYTGLKFIIFGISMTTCPYEWTFGLMQCKNLIMEKESKRFLLQHSSDGTTIRWFNTPCKSIAVWFCIENFRWSLCLYTGKIWDMRPVKSS